MKNKNEFFKKSLYVVLFVFIFSAVGCASSPGNFQMYLPADKVRANLDNILKVIPKEAKKDGWEEEYKSPLQGKFEFVKNYMEGPVFLTVTIEAYKEKEFLFKIEGRPRESKDVIDAIAKFEAVIKKAAKVE